MRLLVVLTALLLPVSVHALDASSMVKVTPLLKTTSSWDGTPLHYPAGQAEISGMVIEVAVGGSTGWHLHPVPSFGIMLQGTLEVHLKDGRSKRLNTGDALAEVVNTLHEGRNVGNDPVRIAVFYAGSRGQVLSVTPTPAEAASPQ